MQQNFVCKLSVPLNLGIIIASIVNFNYFNRKFKFGRVWLTSRLYSRLYWIIIFVLIIMLKIINNRVQVFLRFTKLRIFFYRLFLFPFWICVGKSRISHQASGLKELEYVAGFVRCLFFFFWVIFCAFLFDWNRWQRF